MDKEHSAVIKCFLLNKCATVIRAEVKDVHCDSSPVFKTISFWINETKRILMSTDPIRKIVDTIHDVVEWSNLI